MIGWDRSPVWRARPRRKAGHRAAAWLPLAQHCTWSGKHSGARVLLRILRIFIFCTARRLLSYDTMVCNILFDDFTFWVPSMFSNHGGSASHRTRKTKRNGSVYLYLGHRAEGAKHHRRRLFCIGGDLEEGRSFSELVTSKRCRGIPKRSRAATAGRRKGRGGKPFIAWPWKRAREERKGDGRKTKGGDGGRKRLASPPSDFEGEKRGKKFSVPWTDGQAATRVDSSRVREGLGKWAHQKTPKKPRAKNMNKMFCIYQIVFPVIANRCVRPTFLARSPSSGCCSHCGPPSDPRVPCVSTQRV
jgi:hypothetical protein